MTISKFGKALRNLRMDRGELLKDMAQKLGVTSSYLSAVEVGKRKIPENWIDRIASEYRLSAMEIYQLREAAAQSASEIKIDLGNASASKRDLAYAFAREFKDLSDDQHQAILRVLQRPSKGDD